MTGIVFYTDNKWLIPKRAAGCTRTIFIFIRPKYKDDAGLHAHERTHVRQFVRLPIIHSYLYLLSKKYRFKCEVEAYKRQMQVSGTHLAPLYAEFIARWYNLDVTFSEALEALKVQ